MTATAKSFTLSPNDSGGYDFSGEYFPGATAVVTDDIQALYSGDYTLIPTILGNTEDVFRTFNGLDIKSDVSGLSNVSYTLNFTLSNADVFTQPIDVRVGEFTGSNASQIEDNTTDPSGIGNNAFAGEADNFSTLDSFSLGYSEVDVQADTVTRQLSLNDAIAGGGGITGGDLIAVFSVGQPPGSDQYAGLTYVSDVSLSITGTLYTNLPVITGTQFIRAALDDVPFSPFANVSLQDPGNPDGQSDTVNIINQYPTTIGLNSLGSFSLPADFAWPALANGSPSPAVVTLVQAEQGIFTLTATSV